MEESAKREVVGSLQASLDAVAEEPPKPPCERAKIVISVQDKDGLKQFRMYIVSLGKNVDLYSLFFLIV